jgi:hypothetical protein
METELDPSRFIRRAGNSSKVDGVYVLIGYKPGGVVEDIQRLQSQLERLILLQRHSFQQRQIKVEIRRTGKPSPLQPISPGPGLKNT